MRRLILKFLIGKYTGIVINALGNFYRNLTFFVSHILVLEKAGKFFEFFPYFQDLEFACFSR